MLEVEHLVAEILNSERCKGAEGLAALLRSACFSLGAVFFARMAPARSVFGGFQIGFKKVQTFVDLVDLLESF